MDGQGEPEKVAVLGGGPAAIAAAFELTATAPLRERFEVTVFQPGWRLGGKCASGRNAAYAERIEEHGLHLWFGFYENAFRLMRAAYEELKTPPRRRPATFAEAFQGCEEFVVFDRQGTGWCSFPIRFPGNDEEPGGDYPLPDAWEVMERSLAWASAQFKRLLEGARQAQAAQAQPGAAQAQGDQAAAVKIPRLRARRYALGLAGVLVRAHGHLRRVPLPRAPTPTLAKLASWIGELLLRIVAFLVGAFRDWLWSEIVEERVEQAADLRMFFTTLDTFASASRGVLADGVLRRGWDAINERDLCEWLSAHGARTVTVGATPELRSPLLRAIYDVAFAYPGGVIADANAAAGTALNDLLRLIFTYRGSFFYRMTSGMGDTVFAPLYEVLRARGVRFKFFHAVSELCLSSDGELVDAIEVIPQVEIAAGEYRPLSGALECWPSEPDWSQLVEGERLKQLKVDFEQSANPLEREPRKLLRDRDFHAVVLGISVGALAPICSQLAARHEPFARMLGAAVTVPTQAFQLWLTKSTPELGWPHSTDSLVGTYVEPIDTWCDMTQLIAREAWPAPEPSGLAYFCGVLDQRPGEGHAQATARVKENMRAYVEQSLLTLWPGAGLRSGGFDWRLLAGAPLRSGPARLQEQYWRANTTGSERYVLTPAGSVADRLAADQSGMANLVLAGDWTRTGLDAGCVEAAVLSGMQAARALIGDNRAFTGESPTWLTNRRRSPARRGRTGAGGPG